MMKHRPLRRLTAILSLATTFIGVCLATATPASAARQYEGCISNCKVYDVQGVLDETGLETVNKLIQETSSAIDMYVAVYVFGPETTFSSDYAVMRRADDEYDKLFNPQYGVDTDGVLLLINNSTNYDYLSTSGMAQLYYSNSTADDRVTAILEAITPELKSKSYARAIDTFCTQVKSYYEKGYRHNAFTYDDATGEYYYAKDGVLVSDTKLPFGYDVDWVAVIGVSLFIGVVASGISALIICSSYKKKKSLNPVNYVNQQETLFHVRDDFFLREHTTHVRISSDSGGGGGHGGGSSHHSSGGHSHGGGGHHR